MNVFVIAVMISQLSQDTTTKSSDSHDAMNARGNHAMRFSQTATTHHFLLSDKGGTIQVEAFDSKDKSSIDNIRMHLAHITKMFAEGDFNIPMFVHDTIPPGATEMKRLKNDIRYSYEATAAGARVVISTNDKMAIEAVHKFLRFQIQEHKTGDLQ
jgi:hypothetical protein